MLDSLHLVAQGILTSVSIEINQHAYDDWIEPRTKTMIFHDHAGLQTSFQLANTHIHTYLQ